MQYLLTQEELDKLKSTRGLNMAVVKEARQTLAIDLVKVMERVGDRFPCDPVMRDLRAALNKFDNTLDQKG